MALMNNQKKTCYVGGLADEVDEAVIRAAFIPFGDISEVGQKLTFPVTDFYSNLISKKQQVNFLFNHFMSQVQMPMDYQTEKHRGFAFVTILNEQTYNNVTSSDHILDDSKLET